MFFLSTRSVLAIGQPQVSLKYLKEDHTLQISVPGISQIDYLVRYSTKNASNQKALKNSTNSSDNFIAHHFIGSVSEEDKIVHDLDSGVLEARIIDDDGEIYEIRLDFALDNEKEIIILENSSELIGYLGLLENPGKLVQQLSKTFSEFSENLNFNNTPETEIQIDNQQYLGKASIYQAVYKKNTGEKIIYGKVLDDEGQPFKNQRPEEISTYEVSYFFWDDEKQELGQQIGTSSLTINENGELSFFLQEQAAAGGMVTALIHHLPSGKASEIAIPVHNSTFTIDSTGDQSDASLANPLCLTAAGTCTLRAAIEQANDNGEADDIYFNLPTSGDTGYRDLDNPEVAGSGDSADGDDYWTIRPGTQLPTITDDNTNIDGSSQELLSTYDRNTAGPDVEINGSSASSIHGLTIGSAASNTTINSLVINNFDSTNYAGIYAEGDEVTITNNYIGTSVTSTNAAANYTGISTSTDPLTDFG